MERFELDDVQAQAIVDMRLGQLSGLERDKIESEYAELEQKIAELEDILAHDSRVVEIIKTDLLEIKRKYGDARRTEIGVGEVGIEDEDLIPVEDCVFTLTNAGYVKRIAVSEYRSQHRGGVGVRGMTTKQEDVVRELSGQSLGQTLLTPTKIYVKPMLKLFEKVAVKGVSHITGGGFYENVPRSIPRGLGARIEKAAVPVLPIFDLIQQKGNIPERDMFNTFNMGIGMVAVVDKNDTDTAPNVLKEAGEGAENSDKCEENSRYECDGYSGVYRSLNAIVVVSAECMSNSDAGADGKT